MTSKAIFLNLEKLNTSAAALERSRVEELNERRTRDLVSGVDRAYNNVVYSRAFTEIVALFRGRPSIRILDFGCGEGQFGLWTSRHSKSSRKLSFVGIDLRDMSSRIDRRIYEQFIRVDYGQNWNESLVDQTKFDVCVAMFVFHFKIFSQQLRSIHESLKSGGFLIFNTLSYTPQSIHTKLVSAGFRKIDEEDVPRGVSKHKMFTYQK